MKSLVRRDGKWTEIEAEKLVPEDIVKFLLGNVIPVDAKRICGVYLAVDQSTLNGESLPASKKGGDLVYSGSIGKQGEMGALLISTGAHTLLGKNPSKWGMIGILTVSSVLGVIGVIATFGLIMILKADLSLDLNQIQSLVFLKFFVTGKLNTFYRKNNGGLFYKALSFKDLPNRCDLKPNYSDPDCSFRNFYSPHSLGGYVRFLWLYAVGWTGFADIAKKDFV